MDRERSLQARGPAALQARGAALITLTAVMAFVLSILVGLI